MKIPKDKTKLETARRLRREMTPHERKLWYLFLQKYPIKIYKQRIIDRFIVDFYCASAKLVIEIDGTQHYEDQGMEKDAERTAILESYGLKVLRYSNRDIDRNFSSVCEHIDFEIKERQNTLSAAVGGTSPKGRGKMDAARLDTELGSPFGRAVSEAD